MRTASSLLQTRRCPAAEPDEPRPEEAHVARQSNQESNELRGQLRAIFSRAVDPRGGLKDVVVRNSQIGKSKLDATAIRRERDYELQRLGAWVFEAAEAGELELPESQELRQIFQRIREAEEGLAQQEAELAAVEAEAEMQREHARRAAAAAREAEAAMADDKYDDPAAEEAPAAPAANVDATLVEAAPVAKNTGG